MRDDVEERLAAVARRVLVPGELPAPVLTLVECIGQRFGDCLEALLLYGSGRSRIPLRGAVVYGFVAVVTSYADAFPGQRLLRLVSRAVTPDLLVEGPDGEAAKVLVIVAMDLERETGAGAAASRHLGRFRKRMLLVRARDEAAARRVARWQARALALQSREVLATLPAGADADALARRLNELTDEAHRREEKHLEFEQLADAPAFFREVAGIVLPGRPPRAPA
jgi:hypothetical protein